MKEENWKINLLHVVPRRSLHVAFRSSRTLPENRNPVATRYVPLHRWQNGRANEEGRENERENDGGIAFSSHDAMTSEIWGSDFIMWLGGPLEITTMTEPSSLFAADSFNNFMSQMNEKLNHFSRGLSGQFYLQANEFWTKVQNPGHWYINRSICMMRKTLLCFSLLELTTVKSSSWWLNSQRLHPFYFCTMCFVKLFEGTSCCYTPDNTQLQSAS